MMLIPLLVALLAGNVQIAAACSGPEPSIVQAAVQSMTQNGSLNHYVVAITVTNQGSARQPGNTLQSIAVYQNGDKVDQKGLQPLRPGQSQTVTYGFDRNHRSEARSTNLRFKLVFKNAVPGPVACDVPNGEARLRV
jgi:hypothetical protein